ncbi:MAG: hypothetical protein AAF368_15640 [Planctomycetota bacterium]
MSSKEIDVLCPCCDTLLTVDVLTAKVLRRTSGPERAALEKRSEDSETPEDAEKVREDRWGAASERVASRPGNALEKLENALESERERSTDLDDLFDSAKKRLEDRKNQKGPLD